MRGMTISTFVGMIGMTCMATGLAFAAPDLRKGEAEGDILKFSGGFAATGDATGYLTREDLTEIPGYTTMEKELVPRQGAVPLGVVPFAAILKAYPLTGNADGIILETKDRWESFLTMDFIKESNPMLLVYYDGMDPVTGEWPWFGGDIEPLAPFYAFTPGEKWPTYPTSPEYGMIAATQITGLKAVNTAKRYAPFFTETLEKNLSTTAKEGRRLFLQRCNTCHLGPGQVGGNTSERPFVILQTHATYNEAYFRGVVENPKTVFPETVMPNHPDFEEEQYAAVIAFLKETMKLGAM